MQIKAGLDVKGLDLPIREFVLLPETEKEPTSAARFITQQGDHQQGQSA